MTEDEEKWGVYNHSLHNSSYEPRIATNCFICGNEMSISSSDNLFSRVCDSCRSAIMYAKELYMMGISPNDIAEAVFILKESQKNNG